MTVRAILFYIELNTPEPSVGTVKGMATEGAAAMAVAPPANAETN